MAGYTVPQSVDMNHKVFGNNKELPSEEEMENLKEWAKKTKKTLEELKKDQGKRIKREDFKHSNPTPGSIRG